MLTGRQVNTNPNQENDGAGNVGIATTTTTTTNVHINKKLGQSASRLHYARCAECASLLYLVPDHALGSERPSKPPPNRPALEKLRRASVLHSSLRKFAQAPKGMEIKTLRRDREETHMPLL